MKTKMILISIGVCAVVAAVAYSAIIYGKMAREEGAESIRAEARRRAVAEAKAYQAKSMAELKVLSDEMKRQDEESRKRSGR